MGTKVSNNLKRMKKILLHFAGKYKSVNTASKLKTTQKFIDIADYQFILNFINTQHVYMRLLRNIIGKIAVNS